MRDGTHSGGRVEEATVGGGSTKGAARQLMLTLPVLEARRLVFAYTFDFRRKLKKLLLATKSRDACPHFPFSVAIAAFPFSGGKPHGHAAMASRDG